MRRRKHRDVLEHGNPLASRHSNELNLVSFWSDAEILLETFLEVKKDKRFAGKIFAAHIRLVARFVPQAF